MLDLVFMLMIRHVSLMMGYFSVFMHLAYLSNRRQMEFRLLFMMLFCANVKMQCIIISVNRFMMWRLVYRKVRFKMV